MIRFFTTLAAAIPVLAAGLAFGEISGSKHDFSTQNWSDKEICKPCHTPHNAKIDLTGRIWAHDMSTATYVYHGSSVKNPADSSAFLTDESTSLDAKGSAAQTDFDNASRLCLSCHDGTVALDSFMGKDGVRNGLGIAAVNTLADLNGTSDGLANDHPVGYKAVVDVTSHALEGGVDHYRYHSPAAIKAKGLKLARKNEQFAAGSTSEDGAKLDGTFKYTVSCVTCHNVHNSGADKPGLLRIDNTGSAMCLACHNK